MTIDISSVTRVREPGLGQQWLGKERYVVRGGAVIAVPLMPEDIIEIEDPEGKQPTQLFAFDCRSNNVTSTFGIVPNTTGEAMAQMLDLSLIHI